MLVIVDSVISFKVDNPPSKVETAGSVRFFNDSIASFPVNQFFMLSKSDSIKIIIQ